MKNNNFKKNSLPAFTLMELILYLSVLLIMSVVLSNTFLLLNKGGSNVQTRSELNSNFNFVNAKIKRDISLASNLNTPISTTTSSTTLELMVNGQLIKYAVETSTSRVTRKINSSAEEYISSDLIKISTLNFTRLENPNSILVKKIVGVKMNISGSYNSTSPDLNYTQSQETSFNLNKDFDLP